MKYACLSDIGMRRESNEDYYYAENIDDYYIFIIADGMGGHLAGEVASKLAVDSVREYIRKNKNRLSETVKLINEALQYANSVVYKESLEPDHKNMGTTMELVIVYKDQFFIGHVGDSRTYLYNKNGLNQLTRDHSLINDLLDSGSISIEEARSMPQKNIITRALGSEENINIDIHELGLNEGDIIMICTDGVSGALEDDEIKEIISNNSDLDIAVRELINSANEAGGYDNSTVILAEKR